MRDLGSVRLGDGRRARFRHSTRADGDLSPVGVDEATLERRRLAAASCGPWHPLRQVHGAAVHRVDGERPALERPTADASMTQLSDQVLVVHTGDCVPVGLAHHDGVVAVAHAGWKGLEAGVLEAAIAAMHDSSNSMNAPVYAVVGPHIRPERYEFGPDDLDRLAARFGDGCRSTTSDGRPALDLTAATVGELERLGASVLEVSDDCTAREDASYWSHRARGEAGRIALVAWLEAA